jgi:hypothetical protein
VTCAKAYVRNNNAFYSFIPRQYGELLTAWQGGKTFFKGETLDGDEITIKLAEVEAVMFCTPASQQRAVDRSLRTESLGAGDIRMIQYTNSQRAASAKCTATLIPSTRSI